MQFTFSNCISSLNKVILKVYCRNTSSFVRNHNKLTKVIFTVHFIIYFKLFKIDVLKEI